MPLARGLVKVSGIARGSLKVGGLARGSVKVFGSLNPGVKILFGNVSHLLLDETSERTDLYNAGTSFGSQQGDDNSYLSRVFAFNQRYRAIGGSGNLAGLDFIFGNTGWAKIYDASTSTKLKSPYTVLKYNTAVKTYNSSDPDNIPNSTSRHVRDQYVSQYGVIPGTQTIRIILQVRVLATIQNRRDFWQSFLNAGELTFSIEGPNENPLLWQH